MPETQSALVEVVEPNLGKDRYRMLRRRVWLDLMNMDDEVSQIPSLIQDAAEYTAKAISKQDEAEDFVEQMKAAVCSDLRSIVVNNKTRSESQIATEYPNSESYQAAQKVLNSCRLDASLWRALTDSLRTKAASIRAASDLIQAGYMTSSSIVQKRRAELRQGPPK